MPDLDLIGGKELLAILKGLENKTQLIVLKRVLSDTAQKTFVKELRRITPVRSGKLKRSMGKVTGKSRSVATIFAGPRMSGNRDKLGHKGFIANILEHAKPGRRLPKGKALATPWGMRSSVGPIQKRTDFKGTILRTVRTAEEHTFKSIRTILNREIRKHARR